MKVILTQKVKSLGNIGEIVNVSEGYGRNFLIPSQVAVLADEKNKKALENEQKRLAKAMAEQKTAAEATAKKINGLTITFTKRVGGNGKIFGTVTTAEIANALQSQDIEVEKRQIVITTALKTIGTFEVQAKLFTGVEATFNVKIEMDAKQVEEIKKKQEAAAARKAKAAAAPKAEATEATEEGEATEETTTEA